MSISNPPTSPQPPQEGLLFHQPRRHQEAHEPTMKNQEETRNQLNPQPKSDQNPFNTPVILNQEAQGEGKEEEEEDDSETQQSQKWNSTGMSQALSFREMHVEPPITDLHVAVTNITPTAPFHSHHQRRGSRSKRKKGKPNINKHRAIEKRLQVFMEKLNPIPFICPKILYFTKHEELLKKLGLWDFVHIDIDTDIRVDLIAQLIATYDPKLRCSYVNEFRISVNRAALARALKLPVKKVKGNVSGVDLNSKVLSEEEIEFIEEIVLDWMLLHDEVWLMPSEASNCVGMINDGHPEEVDWAGLFWFMVENELKRGKKLINCYYASHLQYLIKSQHEEVFTLKEIESVAEKMELDMKAKEEEEEEEEEDGNNDADVMEGPTLGQDVGEKDTEMMDAGKCKEEEEEEVEEQSLCVLDGKNNAMKSCSVKEDKRYSSIDDEKERFENAYDVLLDDHATSFLNNTRERVIIQDNDRIKRLRINDSWDQMQEWIERAKMMYEEKEKNKQQLNINRQLLLHELQRRDNMIEQLHKTKLEEIQTRDGELYRLKRELYLMSTILDGYKKAVKETRKAFVEYREKFPLPGEPLYKDAGPGGLMLSATDIEKLNKKQEEEYRLSCLILEQNIKRVEEGYADRFEAYLEKVDFLDEKLTGLEIVMKELTESYAKQKVPKIEEKALAVSET